jgi:hypothetical protein
LNLEERESLRKYLEANPKIEKIFRYQYHVDGRNVNFAPAVPIQSSAKNIPVWLAKLLGLMKMGRRQILPAIWETLR